MARSDIDPAQSPALLELAEFSLLWDVASRPDRPQPLDATVVTDLRLAQLIDAITPSVSDCQGSLVANRGRPFYYGRRTNECRRY
ncbi:MAG: hypothetical protein R6U25_01715 [Alkalispirochaeta sp.]